MYFLYFILQSCTDLFCSLQKYEYTEVAALQNMKTFCAAVKKHKVNRFIHAKCFVEVN